MKLFLRRVLSIAAKEAKHIRRDPFTAGGVAGTALWYLWGFLVL